FRPHVEALRVHELRLQGDALLDSAKRPDFAEARIARAGDEEHLQLLEDGARTAGERLPELENDLSIAATAVQDAARNIAQAEIAFAQALAAHHKSVLTDCERIRDDQERLALAAAEYANTVRFAFETGPRSRIAVMAWAAARKFYSQAEIESARADIRRYVADVCAASDHDEAA
ncbi:MAG: hypothetical protein ACREX6_00970, partial [Casimicrobiaceae bacterium]